MFALVAPRNLRSFFIQMVHITHYYPVHMPRFVIGKHVQRRVARKREIKMWSAHDERSIRIKNKRHVPQFKFYLFQKQVPTN